MAISAPDHHQENNDSIHIAVCDMGSVLMERVRVANNWTVSKLKQQIAKEAMFGRCEHVESIVFKGSLLADDTLLSDAGLKDGDQVAVTRKTGLSGTFVKHCWESGSSTFLIVQQSGQADMWGTSAEISVGLPYGADNVCSQWTYLASLSYALGEIQHGSVAVELEDLSPTRGHKSTFSGHFNFKSGFLDLLLTDKETEEEVRVMDFNMQECDGNVEKYASYFNKQWLQYVENAWEQDTLNDDSIFKRSENDELPAKKSMKSTSSSNRGRQQRLGKKAILRIALDASRRMRMNRRKRQSIRARACEEKTFVLSHTA